MAELSLPASPRPLSLGALAALGRRVALALVGEGCSSIFHLALNLLLMRSLPAHEYGLFAILFTLGSLAISYVQALVATPAAVFLPRYARAGAVHLGDVVFGSVATLLALGFGTATAIGTILLGGGPLLGVVAGGFIGLWSARTYCRGALFARRRPEAAARSDLAFAAAGALMCLPVALASLPAADRLLLAVATLALANAAGVAAALVSHGRRARVAIRARILRRYGRIGRALAWSLLGVTTINVQAQFQAFLVAAWAGPAAYAPIAAAFVLVSPMRLAVSIVVTIAQPHFARHLARGETRVTRSLLAGVCAAAAAACLGYGLVLFAVFDPLSRLAFGPAFAGEPMGTVTAIAWAITATYLAYMAPKALLEAGGAFRTVALATGGSAVIGVAAVAILLATAGVVPSLAGVLTAEIVALAAFATAALGLLRGA